MSRLLQLLLMLAITLAPLRAQTHWELVWHDEFKGAAGSAPDSAQWIYDLGAAGWGNRELERYTDSRENSYLDGKGHLVIRALRAPDGAYTSARIKTQGKFSTQYGKIEARIKLPHGQGMWPAFWMLGADIGSVGWPACGEIERHGEPGARAPAHPRFAPWAQLSQSRHYSPV